MFGQKKHEHRLADLLTYHRETVNDNWLKLIANDYGECVSVYKYTHRSL